MTAASQKFDTSCRLRDHSKYDNFTSNGTMKNPQPNTIILHTLNATSTTGTLSYGFQHLRCSLGRAGIKSRKHEGDGATPRGFLPLLWVYYRPDRLMRPTTGLPTYPLTPAMGWCDDSHDANYNQPVPWPYSASAEHLWREDHIYDLIVVLDFNINPCTKGRGSAIFWHLSHNNFSPTAGCIAIKKKEMLKVLQNCSPTTGIIVC